MKFIANTPEPPYYAVIFTSERSADTDGYARMAQEMVELASEQPGFLGIESLDKEAGITVSYWADLEAIKNWKANMEHREAQKLGREKWYKAYKTRISRVERDYGFQ